VNSWCSPHLDAFSEYEMSLRVQIPMAAIRKREKVACPTTRLSFLGLEAIARVEPVFALRNLEFLADSGAVWVSAWSSI
jgi:hypothetical protein